MLIRYCSTCRQETGHQRALGWGTFFGAIFTCGISLFLIPFYPKRCIICGGQSVENVQPYAQNAAKWTPTSSGPIEETSKKCPSCAEIIKLEAIECRFCGHEFDAVDVRREIDTRNTLDPSFCPKCRNANSYIDASGQLFCPNCGVYVTR